MLSNYFQNWTLDSAQTAIAAIVDDNVSMVPEFQPVVCFKLRAAMNAFSASTTEAWANALG